jgi:hypothetical protein
VCLWPGCIYTYTSPDELYSHYRFNHKPFGRNHASREDSLGLSGPHRFIEPPSWNTSPECVSSNWFSETLERWKAWKTSESPVHLSILAANELLLVTSSIGSTVVAIDQGRWLRNLNLHPFWLTFLSLIFLVNATFTLSCSRLLLLILPPPFKDIWLRRTNVEAWAEIWRPPPDGANQHPDWQASDATVVPSSFEALSTRKIFGDFKTNA